MVMEIPAPEGMMPGPPLEPSAPGRSSAPFLTGGVEAGVLGAQTKEQDMEGRDERGTESSAGGAGSVAGWSSRVLGELQKVFIGQRELVRGVLVALLSDGHILIESVPGLGKTLLVRTLGRILGCEFARIQFTPDLMPSDITGSPIYDERQADFRFRPGPVFTQLLLADEINRAPAKTHSALLEIMQEGKVTIDAVVHPIPRPFLVMATQNPIESEGTYNLPEAQLDRFMFKLVASYPAFEEETAILRLHAQGLGPEALLTEEVRCVTGPEEVLEVQRQAASARIEEALLGYIAGVVRRTRDWPSFSLGASPRAGVALVRGARAAAVLDGRDYVLPDDIQEVALPALRHRVQLTPEAEVEGQDVDSLLNEMIRSVPVPRS
jgi:MoxR-like ATPase